MSPVSGALPAIDEYRLIDGQSIRDLTDAVRALNMTTARNLAAAHRLAESTEKLTAAINALMGITAPGHKPTQQMPAVVLEPPETNR